MAIDFKTLIGVTFDSNQAKTELDRQIKSLQKSSKLALNIELSDKEAKKIIQDSSKAWANYRKEAVSATTAPNVELQKMAQYYKNIDKELKQTAKDQQSTFDLKSNKVQLYNRISAYLRENSKLSDSLKTKLIGIQGEISSVDKIGLHNLSNQFKETTTEARALGIAGKNTFDEFKSNIKSFLTFVVGGGGVMAVINSMRTVVQNVYDIDTAMTSLKKVTNESATTYNNFMDEAATRAEKLATSVATYINQTAEWSKAGYGLKDSANLASVSSLFENVGDVDAEQSVADIVTPLKAFNIEASKAITVVDKLNQVDNEFAVSSADLGEGLRNSASALSLAGNDINQAVAMITGGSEITQNASEMGNAVKVLSMRIRGRHYMPPYAEMYMLCA